jgi:hypothetical protein
MFFKGPVPKNFLGGNTNIKQKDTKIYMVLAQTHYTKCSQFFEDIIHCGLFIKLFCLLNNVILHVTRVFHICWGTSETLSTKHCSAFRCAYLTYPFQVKTTSHMYISLRHELRRNCQWHAITALIFFGWGGGGHSAWITQRNAVLNYVSLATELLGLEILLSGNFVNGRNVHIVSGYCDGTKKYIQLMWKNVESRKYKCNINWRWLSKSKCVCKMQIQWNHYSSFLKGPDKTNNECGKR